MMIHLHVSLPGVWPFRRQVKIEAPEGASVDDVLSIYEEKYKAANLFGRRSGMVILVNGARGRLRHTLNNNDRVKVFKALVRG